MKEQRKKSLIQKIDESLFGESEECGFCHGKGRVSLYDNWYGTGRSITRTCWYCNGNGRVREGHQYWQK
jgi:DnaJ-class molecular chaperone